MAKTGISIKVADSVLGRPRDVNSTSMLIFPNDNDRLESLPRVASGTSFEAFEDYTGVGAVSKAISAYFNVNNGANQGNLLWVAIVDDPTDAVEIASRVRTTVQESFDMRPRQIAFIPLRGDGVELNFEVTNVHDALEILVQDDIRCVAVTSISLEQDFVTNIDDTSNAPNVSSASAPFVAHCIVSPSGTNIGAAYAVAQLAQLSVGTSIGDGGLLALSEPSCFVIYENDEYKYVPVKNCEKQVSEVLGEKGYLFTRTRPPRNGLWWNDGATCNDPNNALSSLEMGRTICSIADDLQSFFVPYINTRVPVTSTGDIQSTYKQVVIDNARAAVIQRYIENGDISDARINLVAKDNDMIGTRTWEVTLSILPAPTLRWIDGYVFYVKNL